MCDEKGAAASQGSASSFCAYPRDGAKTPATPPTYGAKTPAIGVGRDDWFRLPLPPNRTGGSPASGSPVGGFTSSRIVVLPQWLIPVLSTLAPQSMHSASVDGPASSSLLLAVASAFAGSCEAAFVSTGPAV